ILLIIPVLSKRNTPRAFTVALLASSNGTQSCLTPQNICVCAFYYTDAIGYFTEAVEVAM
ncbi:hypothetical protein, partial [Escherichia coli]|uniref:hypothetical protein n=1 Tax=Escherichia coli TaxID=562 RepID=UPI003B786C74